MLFKLLKLFFYNLLVFSVGVMGAELYLRAVQDPKVEIEQLWKSKQTDFNLFKKDGCSYSDYYVPFPFLGYVLQRPSDCNYEQVNNKGFANTHDYPDEIESDSFSILFLGGSVAEAAVRIPPGQNTSFIEKYLNEHFYPPKGTSFKVFSGSIGGAGYPMQSIIYSMYGHLFDAVICLDGYNESLPLTRGESLLRTLSLEAWMIAIKARQGSLDYRIARSIVLAKNYLIEIKIFRNSLLLFKLYDTISSYIRNVVLSPRNFLPLNYFNFSPTSMKDTQRARELSSHLFSTYIDNMYAQTKYHQQKYAHFLQPVPHIGKKLTAEESQTPIFSDPEVYDQYLVKLFKEKNSRKLPVFDLTQTFKDVTDPIYSDFVHFIKNENYSLGYELLFKEMGKHLQKEWALKPKNISPTK